jgi:hypothetical protein
MFKILAIFLLAAVNFNQILAQRFDGSLNRAFLEKWVTLFVNNLFYILYS